VTFVEVPSGSRKSVLTNPLGLSILQALLVREFPGIEVTLVDGQQLSNRAIAQRVRESSPDIVGYSVKPYSLPHLREITADLEEVDALSVFGHAVPTFAPDHMLEEFPDGIMVRHDGEYPMLGIVEHWLGRKDLHSVPGISFIDPASREVVSTQAVPFNLAEMPELDFARFYDIFRAGGEVWLEASRVCAQRCSFCVENEAARGFPRRELPDSYVEYLMRTLNRHRIWSVHFSDSDFVGRNFDRLERLLQIGGIDRIFIDTRSDEVVQAEEASPGFWKRMANLRLYQVYLGIESGAQGQRARFNKGGSPEIDKQAVAILAEAKIDVVGGFIQFDPWVTPAEVAANVRHIREIGTHVIFKPLRAMRLQRGSRLFDRAQQEGLLVGPSEDPLFWEYQFADPHIARLVALTSKWEKKTANIYQGLEALGRLSSMYLCDTNIPRGCRMNPPWIARLVSSLAKLDLQLLEQLNNVDQQAWDSSSKVLLEEHLRRFSEELGRVWRRLWPFSAVSMDDPVDTVAIDALGRFLPVAEEFLAEQGIERSVLAATPHPGSIPF